MLPLLPPVANTRPSGSSVLEGKAERFLKGIREHWGIDNSFNWVLDMAFNEDQSHIHKDNWAINLAISRHIVLNLLRKETSALVGVRAKRLKAGWGDAYLINILLSP